LAKTHGAGVLAVAQDEDHAPRLALVAERVHGVVERSPERSRRIGCDRGWQRRLQFLGIAREGGADRDLVSERTDPRLIVWAQPRKKLRRSGSKQLQVALHAARDVQHDDQPDRLW
jgi:hypothetical protein